MAGPNDEKSISQLISEMANETADLVRTEVRLARAEMSDKIAQIESGLVFLAGGGLVAFSGFMVLLFAIVFLLANWIAPWLSALIVGAIIVIIGVTMLMKGRNNMRAGNLAPNRTIHSTESDADVLKTETRG